MSHPIAYLSFDGNCAEAMRFYETTLGGKLEVLMSGADSPFAGQMPAHALHRIIHARLALPGNGCLMAGDAPDHIPYEGIKGVVLSLNFETVGAAEAVFAALAEGGRITQALQPMFWAKSWGMLTDRFGVAWMVNGEPIAYA